LPGDQSKLLSRQANTEKTVNGLYFGRASTTPVDPKVVAEMGDVF